MSRRDAVRALIVEARSPPLRTAPVCLNGHNLTREISGDEDARLAAAVDVDPVHVDGVFGTIFAAAPPDVKTDRERAKIVLCRLLLGPVAVPCCCEEWDADEYMAPCAYFCRGPVLYVHRQPCRCAPERPPLRFTVMRQHPATHVFRGLLSLAEWNAHLRGVLCACGEFRSDRYVMAVLPERQAVFLDYYPYLLRHLCRFLTVPEIDECAAAMTAHLGPHIAPRVHVHYKILFDFGNRPKPVTHAVPAHRDFFLLELQKLWLSVSYHNAVTYDFFETVLAVFHSEAGGGAAVTAMRLPAAATPAVTGFCLSTFKRQVLYFGIDVRYGRGNKRDAGRASFAHHKMNVSVPSRDVMWRNLFVVYYGLGRGEPCDLTPSRGAPAASAEAGADTLTLDARRYVSIVNRLNLLTAKSRSGERFDFSTNVGARRADRAAGEGNGSADAVGGKEFSEITSVSLNGFKVNAFNTNRVINLKATLSPDATGCPRFASSPRNMTHSFVMYKHTFKEPACTVSTFVSNDVACTNSLNVNIRGSYLEFLYALGVYRLYVNIENFFLPAAVCNSNSSLDVHGLDDQSVIRSERNRVYWTTNFPCMISTTDKVNVGWFKAATAIIPKVSGRALENIMLKELTYIDGLQGAHLDRGLQVIFTEMETRNLYQVPFLTKQFILFLRTALLKIHGYDRRKSVDDVIFQVIKDGFFDYARDIVAHTKIKHTCALIGTRLANNVPKVLVRNKKIKLDHLGRNANILAVCRNLDVSRIGCARLRVLAGLLQFLADVSPSARTREAMLKARSRLCVAGASRSAAL